MKKILFTLLLTAMMPLLARADINTDKAMSRISRDSKTYISADARAETEQAAYDTALEMLSAQIADYFKTEMAGEPMPDALSRPNLPNSCSRLLSQISANRYRVMLYVRKADLKTIDVSDSSHILKQNDEDKHDVKPVSTPAPKTVYEDTTVKRDEPPVNPTVSAIAHTRSKGELTSLLKTLRDTGNISGASAFPLSAIDEYYLVVIKGDSVTAMLHFKENRWTDVFTGNEVELTRYKGCSAFWVTLP